MLLDLVCLEWQFELLEDVRIVMNSNHRVTFCDVLRSA